MPSRWAMLDVGGRAKLHNIQQLTSEPDAHVKHPPTMARTGGRRAARRRLEEPVTTPGPQRVRRDKEVSDRFERFIRRGVGKRGAFPYLVLATGTLAVGAGVLARLTDKDDFHSYGDAIWWALVTLTTVGYGDIVPQTAWGRVIGGFVMLLGITFISFLTATVTSLFISSEDDTREARTLAREQEYSAALKRIEDRLAAIESRLPNQP